MWTENLWRLQRETGDKLYNIIADTRNGESVGVSQSVVLLSTGSLALLLSLGFRKDTVLSMHRLVCWFLSVCPLISSLCHPLSCALGTGSGIVITQNLLPWQSHPVTLWFHLWALLLNWIFNPIMFFNKIKHMHEMFFHSPSYSVLLDYLFAFSLMFSSCAVCSTAAMWLSSRISRFSWDTCLEFLFDHYRVGEWIPR